MKVLQLGEIEGAARPVVLHPRVTVLAGLAGRRRAWLLDVLGGLADRRGLPATGEIDVEGVRFDLDDATLDLLGLHEPRPSVVAAGDLPSHAALDDLDHARARLRDTTATASAVAGALEDALSVSDDDWTDPAAVVAGARARVAAAERSAEALALASDPSPLAQRTVALARRRNELSRVLLAMGPSQAERISRALDAVLHAAQEGPPVAEAVALADAWRDIHQQLDALDAGVTAEERAAQERVAAATRALAEADAANAQPLLTPDQIRKVEEVHAATLEAQDRAEARFAGARARRHLEEVRADEQRVLERLGFSTYADYMMSSSGGSGRGGREVMEARAELAEADAALAALPGAGDRRLRRSELLAQREALVPRATELLGHKPVGPDVEGDLRRVRERTDLTEEVLGPLAARLIETGLDLGPRPHRSDDLITAARAYLADARASEARRAQTREAIAALDAVLAGLLAAHGHGATEVPDIALPKLAEPVEGGGDEAELMGLRPDVDEVTVARTQLENVERIARLKGELVVAARAVDEAQAAVEAAEAGPVEGEEAHVPPLVDRVRLALLARLAANRVPGAVVSVPLVLDEPFVGLGDREVVSVLERVVPFADTVQLVVLTDRPGVLAWAGELPEDAAAVLVS